MEIRVGNCRVKVDFGFPAMLALVFLHADRNLLMQTLAVCLLHEGGHGIAMCLTHAGLREVRLYAAGMQMRTHTVMLSRAELLAIYLSGPAVNLLLAALLWQFRPEAALLHLSMGGFNLLPYRVLDGGAALEAALEMHPEALYVRKWGCMLLSAAIFSTCALWHVENPVPYLMAVYLGASEWIRSDVTPPRKS